ncbi:MAG TPA: hypothetical protein VHH12_02720, partial [Mycobacterium sp.]|nr:hypothetical protein [Mycobacterium sp.]
MQITSIRNVLHHNAVSNRRQTRADGTTAALASGGRPCRATPEETMTRTSFARTLAATLAFAGVAATPLAAQGRGQSSAENRANQPVDRSILTVPDDAAEHRGRGTFNGVATIPRGHLPPAGMCRVWIDGMPPGRQARPTDCRTAVRNAPRNARVIDSNGNTYRGGWSDDRDDRDCRR